MGRNWGGIPCWWPPRSKVVNLQLPIASSSEAAGEEGLVQWSVRCWAV